MKSASTLNRTHRWVLVFLCLMLMMLGFFNLEVAGMMNGPAWLLLALMALES